MDSHKKATSMIIDLQNRNITLRIALLKIKEICLKNQTDDFIDILALSNQALIETDVNGDRQCPKCRTKNFSNCHSIKCPMRTQ